MTLIELFNAVKEDRLTKQQLEGYHKNLSELSADMNIEMAEIEKNEASFFYTHTGQGESDVALSRRWKGSKEGLRQIVLKRYLGATSRILNSLKSRLYTQY